jgi:hypothetical protein
MNVRSAVHRNGLRRLPRGDEKEVFDHLCEIVEEAMELYRKDGKPPPPATSGRDFANKMQRVAGSKNDRRLRMSLRALLAF